MLLFSKQMWEQANVCGWRGGAESHEHFWKNTCKCISNRWWVNLCNFLSTEEHIFFFRGTYTSETWLPNPRAYSQRGHQMTPPDPFLMVTRKLLVLLFTPNRITKLSVNDSIGETTKWYWHEGLLTTSIFLKQCHIMPREVNPCNHCNLI